MSQGSIPQSHILELFPIAICIPKTVCLQRGRKRSRLRLIPRETALDLPPEEEEEKALGKNISLGFV